MCLVALLIFLSNLSHWRSQARTEIADRECWAALAALESEKRIMDLERSLLSAPDLESLRENLAHAIESENNEQIREARDALEEAGWEMEQIDQCSREIRKEQSE